MDTEIIRPHRGSASSDLFICLPSRFSSSSRTATSSIAASSMKISSKSILSPGRTDKFRDPAGGPMSLSSSLSRRLRSNGSMKGGQASPMFPTGSKKRGCGFENPEPSSPKVTCIGQVRVKTKKKKHHQHQHQQNNQGRKVLLSSPTRSMRRGGGGGGGGGGDGSFRRTEHHMQQENQGNDAVLGRNHTNQECFRQRNHNASSSGGGTQKWVHLPLTICEALRAFGAEFNCFLPCRSSSPCGSAANQRENDGKERVTAAAEERGSSCGTAFVRWLVTLQDGEGGNKGREIELVIGGDEEEEDRVEEEEMSWRRRVRRGGGGIGEIEVWDYGKGEVLEEMKEAEEGTRVSVCVPPKNALLLMRCRSDPLRMSALSNRLWESSVSKDADDDDGDELEEEKDGGDFETVEEKCQQNVDKIGEGQLVREKWVSGEADGENHQNLEEEEEEEEELVLMEEEDGKEQTLGGNLEIIELNEVNSEVERKEAEKSPNKDREELEADVGSLSEDQHILDNEENEVMPKFKAEDEGKKEEIHNKLEVGEKECRDEIDSSSSLVSLQSVGEEEAEEEEGQQNNEETAKAKEEEEEEEEECERKVEFLAKASALEAAAGAEEKKETPHRASVPENRETAAHLPRSDPEKLQTQKTKHDRDGIATNTKERKSVEKDRSCGGGGGLAESLLLQMMFEPKLSMEVSKETWVCSTDFIQRPRRSNPPPPLPDNRPVNPIDGPDGAKKKNGTSVDSRLPPPPPPQSLYLQPPRSSCSLPAPAAARASVSMATIIGEKLVNAVAYEPFVLTRCKSEPMSSASKLAPPDACFWKNRKLGAAGVGF